MLKDRTYTRSDFEAFLEQHPDRRLELINGEIVEKMPTEVQGFIIGMIVTFINNFLFENPIGYTTSDSRYGLPSDELNDRRPDVAFVTHETGEMVAKGAAPYMPDLAVEVQSPGQSERFLLSKALYYLDNGARMVWLVYPDKRLVEVLTADERFLHTDGDEVSGGDVLPGLSIPVTRILPKQS